MDQKGLGNAFLELPVLRDFKRRRASSNDKTGGNNDYIVIPPGEKEILAEMVKPGCVRHICVTIRSKERNYLRKIVIKMYWDDEEYPRVEVPIGDFFGIGHGLAVNYISAPLQMSPEDGRGFNCWWPMPYSTGARIEVENQGDMEVQNLYYYVDYEEHDSLGEGLGRFHAFWNRENPTEGVRPDDMENEEWLFQGKNKSGEENYLILEAEGRGHYVGCNMNIHNLRDTEEFNWYGEGDDMIFIDGESEPSILGTGTEDYYGMSWCPTQSYCSLYHGLHIPGEDNWSGKITWYRYHILDPIYFKDSIKVTIEHGHANRRSDDYSSTGYWYQSEPHKHYRHLPPVEERLPRDQ